jgi:hypothetical protein
VKQAKATPSFWPKDKMENLIRLNYFSANEQCFSLTTNQYKYQHKPNFSISEQGECCCFADFGTPHIAAGLAAGKHRLSLAVTSCGRVWT